MRLACTAALAVIVLLVPAATAGAAPKRCEPLDKASCLYPWPSNHYTKRDSSTPTGRRLALPRAGMPANKDGVRIDPSDMNRADGFSPGTLLATKVPGLDNPEAARASRLPSLTNLRAGLQAIRTPVVLINARTGRRHPIWAEVDANPERPEDRLLIIRPARNFTEGETYIVALRHLRTAGGDPIRPSRAFRRLKRHPTARFRRIFSALREAGIRRRKLYLTWDFTIASAESLAGRMLHIRDDAFGALGDRNLRDLKVDGAAPQFTVDSVTDLTPAEDDRIARRVEGTLTVPCYLTNGCAPGGSFVFDRRGRPRRQGTTAAKFTCRLPRSALDAADPPQARPSLYGHGLLGSRNEVNAGNVRSMANEHNFVFCAVDWAGFSNEDIGHIVEVISDFSRFNTVADRMQQGFLHQLLLGRAMIHPQGLSTHPAFQKNGRSIVDIRRLFFDGNSQGAIMGGGLTAVAPDFEHAVLGVPGMNYSTLLQRSVDFDTYAALIYPAYPRVIDRQLLFGTIQLLWDRGEANGYAQHMTSRPLPGTPAHRVLLHVAFGDHQVSDTTAEVEARTIGARAYRPDLDPGRSPYPRLQLLQPIGGFPFEGSAIVFWDTGPLRTEGGAEVGTNPPPVENLPNRSGDDPHENPRAMPTARVQKSEFLRIGGRVVDVCGGGPCYAGSWTGP